MRALRTQIIIISALLAGTTATASAQTYTQVTGSLPLAQAQRPITLTQNTARIDAAFTFARAEVCFVNPLTGESMCSSAEATGIVAGGGFGIIDDFEVGAIVLPLQLTEDFDYGDPLAYMRYRFASGAVEVGAEVTAQVGTDSGYDFRLIPGLPIRVHAGDSMRLDTGAFLPVTFADSTHLGLAIPLGLTFNATPNVFLGPRTGLNILDFDNAGDTVVIPFGFWGGYTIGAGGADTPLADLFVSFDWPFFVAPGFPDALNVDVFAFTLGANIYLGGGA